MLKLQPPHRLLSDERLAALARAGDGDAFALLYARHEKALLGYCRSITRDPEDARDALQTAIVRAYAGIGTKPAAAPARAWLFRIAHNEAVNVLRRRRPEVPLMDGDLETASAAEESVNRVAAHEVLAEVARLPLRQRGALVLRELQGLRYHEIATTLSVTEGNARQLVFAARSALEESRAGRRLPCELVRDVIEVGDRRAQRRRGMRAHLNSCRDCREYARAAAPQRRRAALVLPWWLAGWGGIATGGSGIAAGTGGSVAAKGIAVVAIAAAATAATADRTHPPVRAVVAASAPHAVSAPRAHRSSAHPAGASKTATVALRTSPAQSQRQVLKRAVLQKRARATEPAWQRSVREPAEIPIHHVLRGQSGSRGAIRPSPTTQSPDAPRHRGSPAGAQPGADPGWSNSGGEGDGSHRTGEGTSGISSGL